jgi:hypothetical protein
VLLAIAPVAGLGRVVAAAPEVATALGYDIYRKLEASLRSQAVSRSRDLGLLLDQ